MINTMKPSSKAGHDDQRGEALERIRKEYGAPEDKTRDPVKKLGKDEFFKIMITQIQHQDPLKPYENEQMAAQLAQFSSLEQMVNVNSNLEKLADSQKPLHHLGAAGLIGKWVTADSSRFVHKEGKYSDLKFELPADAKEVRMLIINDKGETVREIEYGSLKKGEQKVAWNGKKGNNTDAKDGVYMMQVSAKNERGASIPVQMARTDVVHGIAYDGKDTVLLTGDILQPQKILLSQVTKIVDRDQADILSKQKTVIGAEGMDISNLLPKKEEGDGDVGERQVEDYEPGKSSPFAPVNMRAFQEMNEKPLPEPVSDDAGRAAQLEKLNDLTAANPNAAAIQSGQSANQGQGLPPSNDGGVMRNWGNL